MVDNVSSLSEASQYPEPAEINLVTAATDRQETQGPGGDAQRKRAFPGSEQVSARRRKVLKVTRACSKRGRPSECHYDAEYRRGQPVTPVQRASSIVSVGPHDREPSRRQQGLNARHTVMEMLPGVESTSETVSSTRQMSLATNVVAAQTFPDPETMAPSRASPELDVDEIQGQYFDTTSGLAFLHRAFRRLSKNGGNQVGRPLPELTGDVENEDSPTLTVGDKPIGGLRQGGVELPSLQRAKELLHLYFDVCIATYRFLHLQSVEEWLEVILRNECDGRPIHHILGRAKAAIVLIIFAIATAHEDKASGRFQKDEVASMARIDSLFSYASALIHQETSRPRLESAQARIIQVLYLLTTSRMNQAWYTFGTAVYLISALGLHRKAGKKHLGSSKDDYITIQCRRRTFWTAYILDKYLGVIFGRPRHYNDDEIDQEIPDSINDEDMTSSGPRKLSWRSRKDCHIDALIYHARIASMISEAGKTVYSIKPISRQERIQAANRLNEELKQWRLSLLPHLGTIAPSSLIPQFRRQATTLKIASSHATMHINRLFLLGRVDAGSETQIREAILAASTVLETVDEMVTEGGTIFHAFWWSHYVTFCALAIVYAWEMQSRKTHLNAFPNDAIDHAELMTLAERCQRHLAQATASNSPSRRYALILDKLRKEVVRNSKESRAAPSTRGQNNQNSQTQNREGQTMAQVVGHDEPQFLGLGPENTSPQSGFGPPLDEMNWSIQEWQSEDWLNLDSMAFGTFPDNYDAPFVWDGNEC
ncbi:hypothetical protein TruAng_009721 [Truncatella angustata]|nr:hypothetical protein TruAng_009721 [Truncatella angustata]